MFVDLKSAFYFIFKDFGIVNVTDSACKPWSAVEIVIKIPKLLLANSTSQKIDTYINRRGFDSINNG